MSTTYAAATDGSHARILKWNESTQVWDSVYYVSWTRLVGVFGFAEDDVWICGEERFNGYCRVYHWDGISWSNVSPANASWHGARDIWGTSSNDIWLACSERIYHWNGSIWEHWDHTNRHWEGVWGFASNDIWVAGRLLDYVAHWDGATWTLDDAGDPFNNGLWDVYGAAPDDVWCGIISGQSGMPHWDGATWSLVGTGFANLTITAVHGTAINNVLAAGGISGADMIRWNGTAWVPYSVAPATMIGSAQSIWIADASHIWVVGTNGQAIFYNGVVWTREDSVYESFYGVWTNYTDVHPPTVEDISPVENSTGQSNDPPIQFSIRDNFAVDQDTIQVLVNTQMVYRKVTGFDPDWAGSTITVNAYNGWDFVLDHAERFEPGTVINVRVIARDTSDLLVDSSWKFTTNDYPRIVNKEPPDQSYTDKDASGGFSIVDQNSGDRFIGGLWGQAQWGDQQWGQGESAVSSGGISLASVRVWVSGELVFNGVAFADGWTGSSYVANSENGYDFILDHDAPFSDRRVVFSVLGTNYAGDTVHDHWEVYALRGFRFSVYRMVVRSMRNQDERNPV